MQGVVIALTLECGHVVHCQRVWMFAQCKECGSAVRRVCNLQLWQIALLRRGQHDIVYQAMLTQSNIEAIILRRPVRVGNDRS